MVRRLAVVLLVSSCGPVDDALEAEPEPYATLEQEEVSCNFHPETGYRSGQPFALTLVTVDGQPVEVGTANAYAVMQAAAAAQGVQVRINDGFRSPAQQQYYYSCYVNCNCNDCNTAAAPGYSNHQSGSALDLNTSVTSVYDWLTAYGANYGFHRTVPSERWHWEYQGGGPGGGPCVQTCDRSSGPFTFSCDGPQSGMACVNVNEPDDPDSWGDNFFCSTSDLGLRWSAHGDLPGMDCTAIAESAEPHAAAWSDDRLCAPSQLPWRLTFSSAGPLAGQGCVQWNEPSDPHSWGDNYLCAAPRGEFSAGGFTFSMAGARAGKTCVNVDEPSDPDTWNDNFFCSDTDVGMRWSFAGPIAGMVCTNVTESAEAQAAAWADNYLCLPPDQPWRFTWSSAGPLPGKTCVRWFEHSETSPTWIDNWLCVEERVLGTAPDAPPAAPAPRPPSTSTAEGDPTASLHLESAGCSTAPTLAWSVIVAWSLRRRSRGGRGVLLRAN